jgi:ribonuclease P protein component
MTVFYLFRETPAEASGPRIGFTVGKALGGAVQRNRIKRRLREAVRLGMASGSVPVDLVINPKRSVVTADFATLQSEVAQALQVIEKSLEKGKLH